MKLTNDHDTMKTDANGSCHALSKQMSTDVRLRLPGGQGELKYFSKFSLLARLAYVMLSTLGPSASTENTDNEVFPTLQVGASVLTNAVVIEANPSEILFRGEGLIYKRVKREELPVNMRDKSPYDPVLAEKFQKEQIEKTKAEQERRRAELYTALLRHRHDGQRTYRNGRGNFFGPGAVIRNALTMPPKGMNSFHTASGSRRYSRLET
jgi:hypothetical protein